MNISSKSITKAQGDLARDFQNVMTDTEALVRTVGKEGEAKYADASKRVMASIDAAKARMVELGDTARVQAADAAKLTDDYVRSNPWQAVGVGAAVGALVGIFFASRWQD